MIQEFQGGNKLAGIYLGTVLQHCTHGYCKIWIPSVYPHEWCTQPDKLPAASQATSIFGGTNKGSGVFTYPNIGSIVYCFFANGDQNSPVYFAASLGGENAFGQYELIHPVGETQSEKHRISSEKSWIQMEQHGELKLQVEDPDRRDATVKYGTKYNDKITADHVSARLSVDAIKENEISNLHCGIYLNNYLSNGTINLQTYQSNPIYHASVDTLTSRVAPQLRTTVVNVLSIDDRFRQDQIYDNNMNNYYDALSSYQKTLKKNTTTINSKEHDILSTAYLYNSLDYKYNNYCHEDINNNYNLRLTHTTNDKDTYSIYVKNQSKDNQEHTVSSYMFNDNYNSGIQFTQNQNVTIESLSTVKSDKFYQLQPNATMRDELTSDVKNQLNMLAAKGLDEKYSRQDTEKHTYHNTAENILSVRTIRNNNFDIDCRDVDMGTTSIRQMKGYQAISLMVNKKGGTERLIDSTYEEIISTKKQCIREEFVDNITKTEYTKHLDTSDQEKSTFEITIKNFYTKDYCKIRLNTEGKLFVSSSSAISMTAPTIDIGGKIINISSDTLNIMGANGDCKIKTVSLLNHVHTEMQSGDVVQANNTKTKTAIESN